MKIRRLSIVVLLLLATAGSWSNVRAEDRQNTFARANVLPFTIAITKLTPPSLPEYLDPFRHPSPSGQWNDFPISPVMIEGELWIVYKNGYSEKVIRYKGTHLESAVRQPDGRLNPRHPTHGTVVHPYLLGRMWYDAGEKKLYAAMHCEYAGYTKGAGIVLRQVHLTTSTDKGLTWQYEGPLLTGNVATAPFANSGSYWEGGDGDFYLYADEPGGYFYLFTTYYLWPKPGVEAPYFMRHRVARCKTSDRMAPGKWQRFYNGGWTEPGRGGRASYVDGHCVVYSSYLKKYVSFNFGSSLSVCNDLSKQDWSPCFNIPGNYWGTQKNLEIVPIDDAKTNTWVCGKTLYLYTYLEGWNAGPGQKYRLEFGPGKTSDVAGYLGWGTGVDAKKFFDPEWEGAPTTDPLRPYGEPSYDNADPIESRRCRKVGCDSREAIYSGTWTRQDAPVASRNGAKGGDSVTLDFRGTGIYWRAQQGPDCGKADVLLDGRLEKTVDCCGRYTPYKFWFVRTDLDANALHTIKIVVRGDKRDRSAGTWIKHMSFEYAAESNRASDGFSGVMGKNDWHYLAWDGAAYGKLEFNAASNCWQKGKTTVGPDYLVPGDGRHAVRQWVAAHAGTIRVEGNVTVPAEAGEVKAQVLHNAAIAWPADAVQHGKPCTHDFRLDVRKHDTVSFHVNKDGSIAQNNPILWNPVITFVGATQEQNGTVMRK